MRRVFEYCALVAVFSFTFYSVPYAQEDDKITKLRLAQGFEEAGEWEHAVGLYEDLNRLDPKNFIFLDGLQRSYTQIKEYGKAINVVRRWRLDVEIGHRNRSAKYTMLPRCCQ